VPSSRTIVVVCLTHLRRIFTGHCYSPSSIILTIAVFFTVVIHKLKLKQIESGKGRFQGYSRNAYCCGRVYPAGCAVAARAELKLFFFTDTGRGKKSTTGAILAHPEKFQTRRMNGETGNGKIRRHIRRRRRSGHVRHFAATLATHMRMRSHIPVKALLESGVFQLLHLVFFSQQFKIPIYGAQAYMGKFHAHHGINLVSGRMACGRAQFLQNQSALFGHSRFTHIFTLAIYPGRLIPQQRHCVTFETKSPCRSAYLFTDNYYYQSIIYMSTAAEKLRSPYPAPVFRAVDASNIRSTAGKGKVYFSRGIPASYFAGDFFEKRLDLYGQGG
jgi:hypothetical protein